MSDSCWCKGIEPGSEWAKVCEALAASRDAARSEVERLSDLAQGRLELFQHSEESRALHFKSAQELLGALEHIETITRKDYQWLYGQPRTSAAGSAHKIAKVAVRAYRDKFNTDASDPTE